MIGRVQIPVEFCQTQNHLPDFQSHLLIRERLRRRHGVARIHASFSSRSELSMPIPQSDEACFSMIFFILWSGPKENSMAV
jgi:hypothetical protein